MRILRVALVALGVAVIALPAGASARQGQNGKLNRSAAQTCKQLRKDMGAEAFRAAYGNNPNKRRAFRKCVKQTRRTLRQLRRAARESCQQPAGTEAVASHRGEDEGERSGEGQDKGAGEGKRGKSERRGCMAGELSDDQAALVQAQSECRADLAADPAAFDAKYGSDEDDDDEEGRDDRRNDDFAECVEEHAKAADEGDDQEE